MNIIEWFAEVTEGRSITRIAKDSGLFQSTVSRQLNSRSLTPETVVAIARAYKQDVIDALVILGLINDDDIRFRHAKSSLEEATDAEIALEVWKRMGDIDAIPAGSNDFQLLNLPLQVPGYGEDAGDLTDGEKSLPYAALDTDISPEAETAELEARKTRRD